MTGPDGTSSSAEYAALNATMGALADQVDRMRRDLSPLLALPTSLQAVTTLHDERMANLRDRCDRDAAALRTELADVRADLDAVTAWQTWAMRLVIGAVIAAVVGLVIAPSALQM